MMTFWRLLVEYVSYIEPTKPSQTSESSRPSITRQIVKAKVFEKLRRLKNNEHCRQTQLMF